MLTKELGTTGLRIPELGLGTWNYSGGPALLRKGLEAGARFIDTAESYGTEPVVAEAIHGMRERVFLASKVSEDHFRDADVRKAADLSLQRLRTDYLDLYQLHHPNHRIPIEETMGAMESLVDAGKVRFIGVSNFSVAELRRAQRVMRNHTIVSNQVRYNLADRTIEGGLLAYCQANHITVIAYSPLGRQFRRLGDCDPRRVLPEVAASAGRTVAQVALNWCLCHESVVAIPKANSVGHLVENCGASGWRLTAEQYGRLNEGIRFRRRSRLELVLRRLVPRGAGGFILQCIHRLPPALRRRIQ
jgi:diketogulonate reductase-like aldo/keto reductase